MSVCPPCKAAGNLLTKGETAKAIANHQLCQDVQETSGTTWCDCQHQTDHSVLATRSDG